MVNVCKVLGVIVVIAIAGCGKKQNPEAAIIELVKQDIIKTAHDPDSIEFVEITQPRFTHVNEGANVYQLQVTYRGKNTYGAMVLVKYLFVASESGQVEALTELKP